MQRFSLLTRYVPDLYGVIRACSQFFPIRAEVQAIDAILMWQTFE